ncbi:putative transcription factor C2C2-GATA family [Rosa chinensis]|uniref:Putative transcription factor C2C2-GATA family n=1 Tax=Rosa chinensis TaxID=74649 RepID=A0A2P6R7G3_ROSCH|nr:erythroid transcription factor [Rosa chinensis]PRQ42352.1 putative transcription factor C2C2-GATA family [Rosa chinensis]
MINLRSKGSVAEESAERSCVDCKVTRTPLWRSGPAGPKTLCNACGIRLRKRLASLNPEDKANKGKRKKSRTERTRPTASVSTNGSTTNTAAGKSTSTTAKSASPPPPPPPAAYGNARGSRGTYLLRAVRIVANKQRVVRKLRWCFQRRRRTNFRRTGFYFFDKNVEQAAVAALLALSCGSSLD